MPHNERVIRLSVEVDASIEAVWDAWTTSEGVQSFFAPACKVELYPGGSYEILFTPDAPEGKRGSEGCFFLALQPPIMLSFTWSAPVHLGHVRGHHTHVTVRLHKSGGGRTNVSLTHDGWGEGGEWDEAYAYFQSAWGEVVMPRLKYRFEHSPVNWDNPPRPEA
jgi:uncharacterized protein YndB with AHSA1/START domain